MENLLVRIGQLISPLAQGFIKAMQSERGEVVIPFMESVSEESRPAVQNFVTNTGATTEDLAQYKSFDDFLSGYKPKAASSSGDWVSTLPEEQRGVVNVKGWKTPSDILKGYSELEKFVGHDKIAMPRKDKNGQFVGEDLDRVFSQLGRPKDPKEYKTTAKAPEGIDLNDSVLEPFKVAAHKLGLLPNQFDGVMGIFTNYLQQGMEAKKVSEEQSHNEALMNLKSKWGLKYEANTNVANMVLRNFTKDKAQADAIVKKYGNDPVLVEMLANVGDNLSEEVLQRSGIKGDLLTPESAQAEINKIKNDTSHPYYNNAHPEHGYWVNRMAELYRMAGG